MWTFLLPLWIFDPLFTQLICRSLTTNKEIPLQMLHCMNTSLYTLDFFPLSSQCTEFSKQLSVSSFISLSLLVLLQQYSLKCLVQFGLLYVDINLWVWWTGCILTGPSLIVMIVRLAWDVRKAHIHVFIGKA